MTLNEFQPDHDNTLSDEQLNAVSGGASNIISKIDKNGFVRYKYSCLNCGTLRPSGQVQFVHCIDGQPVLGVTFTCCNYLCGCAEDSLE